MITSVFLHGKITIQKYICKWKMQNWILVRWFFHQA